MHKYNIKHEVLSKYLFLFGTFIGTGIISFAISKFGLFQDTLNYFSMYNILSQVGIYDAVFGFLIQTGKFEPIIFLLFSFIQILIGDKAGEFLFLFSFLSILNYLFFLILLNKSIFFVQWKPIYYLFLGIVIVSTYLVFSKELYFWRSLLGLVFFLKMFFVLDNKLKLMLFAFYHTHHL